MKNSLLKILLSFLLLMIVNLSIANHEENNCNEDAVNDLILVGLLDGPLAGTPKFAEIYVVNDIADMSLYGLGSANNGGGTDGQEWTFPAVALTAGSTIYVANDTAAFTQFMGFSADFEDGGAACNFNGDDAFEVFENGNVIDVFGLIDMDGTGLAWEHTDGWAKRVDGTGPDGTTFVEANWVFSGLDVFDNQTTNDSSPVPYPIGGGPILTNALTIKGLIYASTNVKVTEYEVLKDIPDLSVFGTGCANNGGGTDGQEWTFPAVSATEGQRIYVARSLVEFSTFFGFAADFEDPDGLSHNFNGDDAFELYENGTVIDVFGDVNVDGTGEAWEYTNGWAHRVDGTGPDGETFNLGNWTFSAIDNFVDVLTNDTATEPYPVQNISGPTGNLVLVGMIYANADAKITEYYALDDIPDLSIYGLGCANNGGGSDGEEWTFPAVSASAGDRIYVARDSAAFTDFFGFNATFYDPSGLAHNFNGDDPFELFENGEVIDTYGDVELDGTGEAWEYVFTWAQRDCATGPDGLFVLDNWTIATNGVFDGVLTNDASVEPYPLNTYMLDPCGGSNVTNDLVLVGIIYANADAKITEYYALDDIPDLSTYGLGCANNGGGSDGQEWTFPAVSASAGDRIYVARDSAAFADFFGFNATFLDPDGQAHNFNGDDPFELFENGEVIDTYGDVELDGTGEPWEHVLTWAQRDCATGPDGLFVLDNWTIGTMDALSGAVTNDDSAEPYPLNTYMPEPCGGNNGGGTDLVMTEIMYNSPGTDLEFIEFYNNTADAIDMTGYSISNAVVHTFPAFTLAPGEYALITDDSVGMETFYGVTAFQWESGSLNNGGEAITLLDAVGMVVDSVNYDDAAPWSVTPDGRGPSLILCDTNADNNDGANWQRALSNSGNIVDGREVFANPGVGADCVDAPIVAIQAAEAIVGEADVSITVLFYIDNPDTNATSVDLSLIAGGSADASDYTFSPSTITFPGGTDTFQMVTIDIIDDLVQESEENFAIEITNPTNNAIIANSTMNFTIVDNDAPISNSLVITGLVHGPIGGVPKATEFYVVNDIPNLSLYGLGCANNGGGSDGQEWTFPSVAMSAGTCFYVSNDTSAFTAFFGFSADFQDDGAANNFNGDDAYEVFESGTVIDVFGEIDADGTGTPWEYSLGWVHRKQGTGPDGSTFVFDNWEYGGIDALLDATTNATANTPYPVDMCGPPDATENVDFSQQIRVFPNPASNVLQIESDIPVAQITISNILGQVLLELHNPSPHTNIDISDLTNNVYVISFISDSKRWSQKIVVRK